MDDDDLLEEIQDDVEALAAQLPGPRLAALCEERARGIAPGAPGRAEWLTQAGDRWQMEGDLDRAKACFEQAAQDGGRTNLDPRCSLVDVLLEMGDTPRADEILADLRRDLKAGWSDPFVHEMVGETLELHGRLEDALRWFSSGLTRAEREDPDAIDIGCLNGRYRVRRALGLPVDRYDLLCEERRREYATDLEEEGRRLQEAGGTAPALMTVLYWPPDEFALVLDRWPEVAELYGSEHAEHRGIVERHLRALAEERSRVAVCSGDFSEYLEYAEKRADHGGDAATRAGYAAHLGHLGRSAPFPPGRNDRCWCGSGLKYKKCCGALRFAPE